ncbi:MAG: hypothetical protein R2911_23485 [Caldilineaceae bacterium]
MFDHIRMQNELAELLHRKVDLISKQAIENSQNWIRRQEILETAQVYFSMNEVVHARDDAALLDISKAAQLRQLFIGHMQFSKSIANGWHICYKIEGK